MVVRLLCLLCFLQHQADQFFRGVLPLCECVCVWESVSEWVCVSVWERVCVSVRERVCECVWERVCERESVRECVWESVSEWVCVCERESVSECVCECVREREIYKAQQWGSLSPCQLAMVQRGSWRLLWENRVRVGDEHLLGITEDYKLSASCCFVPECACVSSSCKCKRHENADQRSVPVFFTMFSKTLL